ncbi:MAG: endonuclease/exonuclease/phosphatase family protein [Phycisphaerales bacterium]
MKQSKDNQVRAAASGPWRRMQAAGRMCCVLVASAVGLGAALLFVMGRVGPAPVEAITSPFTAHACVALCVAAAVFVALRAFRRAAALGVLCAWAAVIVGPVVLPHASAQQAGAQHAQLDVPAERAPDEQLRVASFNALVSNAPSEEKLRWLVDTHADVLCVVECNTPWLAALKQARENGQLVWPHCIAQAHDDAAIGIAILSRFPLEQAQILQLPGARNLHAVATAVTPGGSVRVLAVHPMSPVSIRCVGMRNDELAWLAGMCAASSAPTLVVGDFNETPYGRAFAQFVDTTGYASARNVAGVCPTWPGQLAREHLPMLAGIPIDHVLMSRHFAPVQMQVGPYLGSDHLPVVADVLRVQGAGGLAERVEQAGQGGSVQPAAR